MPKRKIDATRETGVDGVSAGVEVPPNMLLPMIQPPPADQQAAVHACSIVRTLAETGNAPDGANAALVTLLAADGAPAMSVAAAAAALWAMRTPGNTGATLRMVGAGLVAALQAEEAGLGGWQARCDALEVLAEACDMAAPGEMDDGAGAQVVLVLAELGPAIVGAALAIGSGAVGAPHFSKEQACVRATEGDGHASV